MPPKTSAATTDLRQLTRRAESSIRANREEAQRLLAFVRERMGEIAAGFYDVGAALARLRAPAYYGALGHDSFEDLLSAVGFSKAQAYRFITIAERMSRERATELGPRRAVALLRLTSATPGEESVEDVLRRGVTLPGRKEPLLIAKLTAEQLEDAARTIARAHRSPKERVPAPEYEVAQAWAAAVREHLHAAGHLTARVSLHRRGRRDEREALIVRLEFPFEARGRLPSALRVRPRR